MTLPSKPPVTLEALQQSLSYLFEPTPILLKKLAPAIHASGVPETWTALVDLCAQTVDAWVDEDRALILSGHPAIGETKGLSPSSSAEQIGKSGATPQVVLDRLAHLNKLYELQYPTLRYLIFVNGRSRQEIVTLLETHLSIPNTPVPLTEDDRKLAQSPSEPPRTIRVGSAEWKQEVARGTNDVWQIARDRLGKQNLL